MGKKKLRVLTKTEPVPRAPRKRVSEISIAEQAACFELYLQRKHGLRAIAQMMKVPFNGLEQVATKQDWPAKREEIETQLAAKYEREMMHVLNRSRAEIIERHVNLTGHIDRHVYEHLKGKKKLPVSRIESLAKSLNLSAGVAARAVGLDKVVQGNEKLFMPGMRGRRPGLPASPEQKGGEDPGRTESPPLELPAPSPPDSGEPAPSLP